MSSPTFALEVRPAGLYLPALDLFLDPERDVPRAFVSHAHGDHGGGWSSGSVFASRETLALLQARRGAIPGARTIGWDESIEIATDDGMARISIVSAGHMLGAAQLVVDHPGGRFAYTGDYRTGTGATHAEGAPVECDTLAIESTFGLPMFHFPDREQTLAAIVAWCRGVLSDGETPVLLAYALGKSQVLARAVVDAGMPVIAHGASFKMCEVYEALGVPLGIADGALRPYAEEKKRKSLGGVLIAPPRASGTPMIKGRKGFRVGYVSGWAVIDASVERVRAEAGFALSDHADFDDLMETVRASRARFVYTTHGEPAVFARLLNDAGIVAEPREVRAIDASEEAIE
jgi:putative mRNA 3-end processing factor